MLHLKLTLFVVAVLLMLGPTRRFRRWQARWQRDGALPGEQDIASARKLVMLETHLVAVIPLAAVFLARGFGN